MSDALVDNEPLVRLVAFLAVFVAMATWEVFAPRRERSHSRLARWPNNAGVVVLDTLLLRLVFPAAAVGMALYAEQRGWGIFNVVDAPEWLAVVVCVIALDFAIYLQHVMFLAVVVCVIALDFAIYLQHVMFHAVPVLWRLHRMHHADLDFDVTTGVRFHPVEIILSMLIKFAAVIVLGAPVVAVVVFEVLLNATSMFNHGNVVIPPSIERVLRLVVVTPEMHRVHHSIESDETNSNFGFNLSWWDRLMGTYRSQPRAGHVGMTIGIDTFRDERNCVSLLGMLLSPFVAGDGYSIRGRWSRTGDRMREER